MRLMRIAGRLMITPTLGITCRASVPQPTGEPKTMKGGRHVLKDKVAIITGSSRGIGLAIAKKFAENSAKVAINASGRGKDLDKALELLKQLNADVMVCRGSVENADFVKEMIAEVMQRFGAIDILVNNAGINRDKPVILMSGKDWDDVMNVNLKGAFFCCKEVLRYMIKNKTGKIINISSITATLGREGQTNYGSSKAGLIGFTKSLAREVGKYNILVNAMVVGLIDTMMTKRLPKKSKDEITKMIPLGRIGRPEEVANACLFLSSDLSTYVTGATLNVCGGGGI